MMKIILFLIAILACTANGITQKWETDLETAKSLALKEGKVIILLFQGSDWCAPCKKLDKEVWSKDTFQSYAADNFVLLQADFPRRKKNALPEKLAAKNAKLAEQFNPQGIFPFVVILDTEGNILGQTGYEKMDAEEYIAHLESIIQ